MKNKMQFIKNVAGAGVIVLSLAGCAGQSKQPSPMPPVAPVQQYHEPEDVAENQGSLYMAAEADSLYADNRAHRVGDIILINIVENAKSKSKADTTSSKTSGSEYGVTAAFGRSKAGILGTTGAGLGGSVGVDPIFSTTTTTNLSATGETKRENYVTATIGARVMQVLPGGVLQLAGAREIRVNEETQYMVVSGLVRTKDIAGDNSVLSTQMADSKVEYWGDGELANKQRQGWLTQILNVIWPF